MDKLCFDKWLDNWACDICGSLNTCGYGCQYPQNKSWYFRYVNKFFIKNIVFNNGSTHFYADCSSEHRMGLYCNSICAYFNLNIFNHSNFNES